MQFCCNLYWTSHELDQIIIFPELLRIEKNHSENMKPMKNFGYQQPQI